MNPFLSVSLGILALSAALWLFAQTAIAINKWADPGTGRKQ
jgi:hypothetical protein